MAQYIDKSALVAEIKKRLKANGAFDEVGDEAWAEDKGMCEAYRSILSFIDTLEVKEVDLGKEVCDWYNNRYKPIDKDCDFEKQTGHWLKNLL